MPSLPPPPPPLLLHVNYKKEKCPLLTDHCKLCSSYQTMKRRIEEYQVALGDLSQRSKHVVPLRKRRQRLAEPIPIIAVCDFPGIDVSFTLYFFCLLEGGVTGVAVLMAESWVQVLAGDGGCSVLLIKTLLSLLLLSNTGVLPRNSWGCNVWQTGMHSQSFRANKTGDEH